MAGRRIRDTVSEALRSQKAGGYAEVTPVIAGLSNAYCGYLTTREEYALQWYEGSSTHFGPNQLVATQQELSKLANALIMGDSVDRSLRPPKINFASFATGVIHDVVPLGYSFGDVVKDKNAKTIYWPGEEVSVEFHGAHPKNDLRLEGSYMSVQREGPDKGWVDLFGDSHPDTVYEWARAGMDMSRVTIKWCIPNLGIPQGRYRLVHFGNYKSSVLLGGGIHAYQGASRPFDVVDPKATPHFNEVYDPALQRPLRAKAGHQRSPSPKPRASRL